MHGIIATRKVLFFGLFLAVGVFFSSIEANAEIYGDYNYKLYNNDSEIIIYRYLGSEKDLVIPNEIDNKPVIQIDNSAFSECNIESVTIPDSISFIDNFAFSNCSNLKKVTFQGSGADLKCGSYIFSDCISLENVVFPSEMNEISASMFKHCSSLKTITIPEGITSIGDNAFENCEGLQQVILPDSLINIGQFAFSSCKNLDNINIPQNVTSINGGAFLPNGIRKPSGSAFYGCDKLTEITVDDNNMYFTVDKGFLYSKDMRVLYKIPAGLKECEIKEGVTEIAAYAFAGQYQIENITFTEGVTYIGANAFQDCSNVKQIILPDSLQDIGNHAFSNCKSIEKITIPKGVEYLGSSSYGDVYEGMFSGCDNLQAFNVDKQNNAYASADGILCNKEVTNILCVPKGIVQCNIPQGVKNISSGAFSGCNKLERVEISDGVESIGNNAFMYCENLKSVTMTDSVKEIGTQAFGFCGNLSTVRLSNNLGMISKYLFYACKQLVTVNIPDNITDIGEHAFDECNSLTGDLIIPDSVTTIGESAFNNCYSLDGALKIGANVETIGENAFSAGYIITETVLEDGSTENNYDPAVMKFKGDLVLPKSLKKIGDKAFYNCKELTGDLIIPDSVIEIGQGAFEGCSGFDGNLIISDGITKIYSNTFRYCSGLKGELAIPENITIIGDNAFEGCSGFIGSLVIPDSVELIGEWAFNGCDGLGGSFVIPKELKDIGNYAFAGDWCFDEINVEDGNESYDDDGGKNLIIESKSGKVLLGCDKTVFSSRVKSIGAFAFMGCHNLNETMLIPDNVTLIDWCAFYKTGGIKKLYIPANVSEIGQSAFKYCSDLCEIMIDENNTVFNDGEGCNVIIETERNNLIQGCSSSIIPDSVKIINEYAFAGYKELSNIIIPDGVEGIGMYAFENCNNLKTLSIPNSVKWIDAYTFSGCTNLESIVLSNQIEELWYGLFKDCIGLKNVTVPSSVNKILDDNLFDGCSDDITILTESGAYAENWAKGHGYKVEIIDNDEVPHTHSPAEVVKENNKAATCTEKGSYEEVIKCSVCGEEISRKTIEIPALGHDFGDWTITKVATETEDGIEERVCKNDASHKETRSIAKALTVDKDNQQAGDNATPKSTETPAAKDTMLTDESTKATFIVTSSTGEEPTVEYKNSTSIDEKTVIIPDSVTIDGVSYKVTEIADNAFANNKTVEKVVISSNIRSIGDGAFSGCTKLKSVTIPTSVSEIGDKAFKGCTSLISIKTGNGVTEIGDSAFEGCKKLKSVTIGSKVTEIGDNAFANCPSLTKIIIPAKVTKIGKNAFKGNKKLKTITIKSTKLTEKSISKNAFKGVGSNVTIKVTKKMKKAYTKLFRKRGLSKKVKIKSL